MKGCKHQDLLLDIKDNYVLTLPIKTHINMTIFLPEHSQMLELIWDNVPSGAEPDRDTAWFLRQ